MAGFAEVSVQFHPTEIGGRRTPVFLGEDTPAPYRLHLRVINGRGEYLAVEFIDGPDNAIPPGCESYTTVRFLAEPLVSYAELATGAKFEILEGSRVVGNGRVTRR